MKQSEFLEILALTKRAIAEYKNWGETEIYKGAKTQEKTEISADKKSAAKNIKTLKEPNASDTSVSKTSAVTMAADVSAKEQELKSLCEKLKTCRDCPLGESRLNCVFGEGSACAEIMFVGEGPGYDEDHQGRPFIGRAGQLLDKIIEAMKYKREDVYIANIVKCHPMKDPSDPEQRGNDRPPTPQESSACKTYLDMQIDIIKPKVIITLGSPSSKALLDTKEGISLLRGIFKEYRGMPLMPTYHPAAVLRNPNLKKDVWEDMKKVMEFLELRK
jgi:DNA polymerase